MKTKMVTMSELADTLYSTAQDIKDYATELQGKENTKIKRKIISLAEQIISLTQ